MKKIWEKQSTAKTNTAIESYCFAEGVEYDNKLVLFDVLGSLAHLAQLEKMKIISAKEAQTLHGALLQVIKVYEKGKFIVQTKDEDVHTKVEAYLIDKVGEPGKKLHTGRSRNDQVALDMRLYAKQELLSLAESVQKTVHTIYTVAKKYEYVPMPGYTHLQKAMPSSVGMWMGSFMESLMDDVLLLKSAYMLNDQSPLGSGAAYGVPLALDREFTASLLGFPSIVNNSPYSQASRPKTELAILQSLVQIMITASKFASDLLLFTTSEFNYFSRDKSFYTGSSIMPQKQNLDAMENMRAKAHVVIGHQQMVATLCTGLPSGYNGDFAQTKKYFMDSVEIAKQTLNILDITISQIVPNSEVLKKACTKELYATHAAYDLVTAKGMSFRDAYKQIGSHMETVQDKDPVLVLKQASHSGSTGNLGLEKKMKEADTFFNWWEKQNVLFTSSINNLLLK